MTIRKLLRQLSTQHEKKTLPAPTPDAPREVVEEMSEYQPGEKVLLNSGACVFIRVVLRTLGTPIASYLTTGGLVVCHGNIVGRVRVLPAKGTSNAAE